MSVSFKDWNPIGKTEWPKKGNNVGGNEKQPEPQEEKKRNTGFSEKAATLELSKDYVRVKSNTIGTRTMSTTKAVTRTLKVGSSGSDVSDLQRNLNSLGYNAGTPDGKFGNGTKNAVISFQKTYGLSPDGIAGPNTLNAVSTSLNRQKQGILAKGQVSDNVRNLQNNLIKLGYLSGKADGAFGSNTEKAVIKFQTAYGLSPDGLAGSVTQKKINDVIAGLSKPTEPSKPTNPSTPSNGSGTVRNVPIDTNYKNKAVNTENAKYVYNALIKAGFTKESAAGVMGNLDVENAFKTAMSGDQGSVGIAQWKDSRKDDLVNFAAARNASVESIEIQTQFLIEADLKKQLGDANYEKLKTMTDYIDAADFFCGKVERPSSYKTKTDWENGMYGPNFAQHNGPYMISWDRYEWSDQMQTHLLDLKKRRSAASFWYNN